MRGKYMEYLYNRLLINKLPLKDLTILTLDFNTKSEQITVNKEVKGKDSLSKVDQKGEIFTYICAFNRLITGDSVVSTRISPENRTQNQTDHICIDHK